MRVIHNPLGYEEGVFSTYRVTERAKIEFDHRMVGVWGRSEWVGY